PFQGRIAGVPVEPDQGLDLREIDRQLGGQRVFDPGGGVATIFAGGDLGNSHRLTRREGDDVVVGAVPGPRVHAEDLVEPVPLVAVVGAPVVAVHAGPVDV